MKKVCFIISLGFLLNSCATLFHSKNVDVCVNSDTDSVKIYVNDDTTRYYTPTIVNVERSSKDLLITALKDSASEQINIKSRLSTAFWLGNLFSGIGIFGYAIDLTNPKRYTYPSDITIHFNESKSYSTKKYSKWVRPEKNLLSFKLSIPEGNFLYLNKGNEYGNAFGFHGLSGGVEYYFSDKYCINMDIGRLTDLKTPFSSLEEYHGRYQRSFATYGDIQVGSDFRRFHYDLGLQFNRTSHFKIETVEQNLNVDSIISSKYQNNVGIALSAYYRISNNFNIGINYYPSFISWDENKVLQAQYTHLLFFELNLRLEAFRQKENLFKRLYKMMQN